LATIPSCVHFQHIKLHLPLVIEHNAVRHISLFVNVEKVDYHK
jgi:hypothetical protein